MPAGQEGLLQSISVFGRRVLGDDDLDAAYVPQLGARAAGGGVDGFDLSSRQDIDHQHGQECESAGNSVGR